VTRYPNWVDVSVLVEAERLCVCACVCVYACVHVSFCLLSISIQEYHFIIFSWCVIFMHAHGLFCRVALMKTTAFKYEPVMTVFHVADG